MRLEVALILAVLYCCSFANGRITTTTQASAGGTMTCKQTFDYCCIRNPAPEKGAPVDLTFCNARKRNYEECLAPAMKGCLSEVISEEIAYGESASTCQQILANDQKTTTTESSANGGTMTCKQTFDNCCRTNPAPQKGASVDLTFCNARKRNYEECLAPAMKGCLSEVISEEIAYGESASTCQQILANNQKTTTTESSANANNQKTTTTESSANDGTTCMSEYETCLGNYPIVSSNEVEFCSKRKLNFDNCLNRALKSCPDRVTNQKAVYDQGESQCANEKPTTTTESVDLDACKATYDTCSRDKPAPRSGDSDFCNKRNINYVSCLKDAISRCLSMVGNAKVLYEEGQALCAKGTIVESCTVSVLLVASLVCALLGKIIE